MLLDHDGKALHAQYQSALPFPHIVLEPFYATDALTRALHALHTTPSYVWRKDEHAHQKHKHFLSVPAALPPAARTVLEDLQSARTLRFLTDLTGIANLKADPTLNGGGIHRIGRGGRLEVHADFNVHPKLGWYRRLNLLLYLNPGWNPAWQGALELWEPDMSRCARRIEPVFNRAVIFTITDQALHGHPHPLRGAQRLSIALYYYTVEPPPHIEVPHTTASWKQRP